jgi:hypothetical protein
VKKLKFKYKQIRKENQLIERWECDLYFIFFRIQKNNNCFEISSHYHDTETKTAHETYYDNCHSLEQAIEGCEAVAMFLKHLTIPAMKASFRYGFTRTIVIEFLDSLERDREYQKSKKLINK